MHLEAKTRSFLETLASLGGPPLHKRTIFEARQFLANAQAGPHPFAPAQVEKRVIASGPTGEIRLVIVRPLEQEAPLPALLYLHGGGWILGDWRTHERLVREFAAAIPAVVVFVDYAPSPEQRFPIAIEQAFDALRWVVEQAEALNIDATRLAIIGDSVGGNMANAVTMLARDWAGPPIAAQVLFYPVTDANFETPSYKEFASGTNLTRDTMRWFWDAYLPDVAGRLNPLAAPLQATVDQLRGLPRALVITGENDVLRDEGEAYAHKLAEAGVEVTAARYLGTIHDFVMLDALASTPAALAAMTQSIAWLRDVFQTGNDAEKSRPGAVTFMPEHATKVKKSPRRS